MKTYIVMLACGAIEQLLESDYWSLVEHGLLVGHVVISIVS